MVSSFVIFLKLRWLAIAQRRLQLHFQLSAAGARAPAIHIQKHCYLLKPVYLPAFALGIEMDTGRRA